MDSGAVPRLDSENWARGVEYVNNLPDKFPFVKVINVADIYLDSDGRLPLAQAGRVLYIDDDHLSEHGAQLAEPRIRSVLESLLKK